MRAIDKARLLRASGMSEEEVRRELARYSPRKQLHVDASPVLLPERVAIQRYREWSDYRRQEGDRECPTFCEWLRDANIEVLAPEWTDADRASRTVFGTLAGPGRMGP